MNAIVPAVPYGDRPQLLLRGLDSLYVSYYLKLPKFLAVALQTP